MKPWIALASLALFILSAGAVQEAAPSDERYLRWSVSEAETIGKSTYRQGRVGGAFDTRLLKTDRSYNYKLGATWLTADVIRATVRLLQVRSRLSDDDARTLVAEAEQGKDAPFIVEIDPREGSGIIPRDWEAFLQPKGRTDLAVRGTMSPQLREVRGLAGVLRRNYDYDRFWVTFPLESGGVPLFRSAEEVAELVVRIHDKEGRLEWRMAISPVSP
jgi:hypothetical protein